MNEIKIKVDFEKREIHGIECDHENKFEVAKVLMNIASGMFNKMVFKTNESKIIKPKIKIAMGGDNGKS